MTLDTRVVDWLGHSGASFKNGPFWGRDSFFLSAAAVVYRSEALLCSGVSQAVISTTYDWIFLYKPESQLDL